MPIGDHGTPEEKMDTVVSMLKDLSTKIEQQNQNGYVRGVL